jgi:hypothetical protein
LKGTFDFFDFLYDTKRKIDPLSPPSTIVGAVKAYVRFLGCTATKQSPHAWFAVEGPSNRKDALGALLAGLRRAYDALVEGGYYPFANPLLLSEEAMRDQRLRAVRSGRGKSHLASLGDALFRLTTKIYAPPRRTQVELIRNAYDWAVEAGWPEALLVYLRILKVGGCRPSDPSRVELLDWYLATRCGNGVSSSDKSDPKGRPKIVRFEDEDLESLQTYVDNTRFAACPPGEGLKVADIIRLGDAGHYDQLRQPLLLNPDGRAWKYNTISRNWWRPLMMAFCVDPVTGRRPMRFPTLHWIRHLFVYDHLMLIELEEDDESGKSRAKENLRAYIGWSLKSGMLATYGREFEDRKVAQKMIRAMGRRSQMADRIRAGDFNWAAPREAAPKKNSRLSNMLRDRDAVAA